MTQRPRQDAGSRSLRALAAVNGIVALSACLALVAVSHRGPLSTTRLLWSLAVVFAAVGTIGDRIRLSRRGEVMTFAIAVADAMLAVAGMAAGLMVVVPWAGIGFLCLGYLAWLGRCRALERHVDGPLLVASLCGMVAYVGSLRPWAPTSSQWAVITWISAAGAGLALASGLGLVRSRRSRL